MAEGMKDAIVINRGSYIVCLLLQGRDGISHSDTNTGLPNHRGVIATITESHGPTGVKTFVTSYCEYALTLIGSIGCDISKFGMPTP